MAATASCVMAIGRIVQSRPGRACRGPSRQGARPGRRGRRGENPLYLVDPAEVGAADEESRCAIAGSLPAWGIDRLQEVLTAVLAQNLKINVTAVGRGGSEKMQPKRLDAHSDGADRQLPGRQ